MRFDSAYNGGGKSAIQIEHMIISINNISSSGSSSKLINRTFHQLSKSFFAQGSNLSYYLFPSIVSI